MSGVDWRRSTVTAADGVQLAVFTAGRATGATVLLVHGYPDDHTVWNSVAALLEGDFRLVSYDVRGAGASQAPTGRSGYRLAQLVRDVETVAGTVGEPVHILAHDWGSVQAWQAVTRPGAAARYASITSVSGPALAYSSAWYRTTWAEDKAAVLRQARASYYLPAFLVPALPELAWRTGLVPRLLGGHQPSSRADGIRGLALYRANARRAATGPPRACPIPALVIAPRRDPFITAAYAMQAPAPWVRRLRTHLVDGGHWTFVDQPQRIAEPVVQFVTDLDSPSAATDPDDGGG